jgi:hypothetical protein
VLLDKFSPILKSFFDHFRNFDGKNFHLLKVSQTFCLNFMSFAKIAKVVNKTADRFKEVPFFIEFRAAKISALFREKKSRKARYGRAVATFRAGQGAERAAKQFRAYRFVPGKEKQKKRTHFVLGKERQEEPVERSAGRVIRTGRLALKGTAQAVPVGWSFTLNI